MGRILHSMDDNIVPASIIREKLLKILENVFKRFLEADLNLDLQSV
jgi:hypothetical protein